MYIILIYKLNIVCINFYVQNLKNTHFCDNFLAVYNYKAYSIQGDAQFQLTLFEEALISYQRANRYRPGVRQYQEGINRVESVINRAIGGIKSQLVFYFLFNSQGLIGIGLQFYHL